MSPRRLAERLEDIAGAAESILEFTAGITRDGFAADELRQSAVHMQLVILGEAASHLPTDLTAPFPTVPWPVLRAMRNVIAHEYFRLDVDIVWHTATVQVPQLLAVVRTMLAEQDSDGTE